MAPNPVSAVCTSLAVLPRALPVPVYPGCTLHLRVHGRPVGTVWLQPVRSPEWQGEDDGGFLPLKVQGLLCSPQPPLQGGAGAGIAPLGTVRTRHCAPLPETSLSALC